MTFDPNQPNPGQSPALFPAGALVNFTRLKTIINADHIFNDTAAANDGIHRQVTLANRENPTPPLVAGANTMVFSKSTVGVSDLWFCNNVVNYQISWRELSGVVNGVNDGTFTVVAAIPTNCYGYVYFFKARTIQAGTFLSDTSLTAGFAYGMKLQTGQGISNMLQIGNDNSNLNTPGLNLTVLAATSAFNGNWNYRIFYRKYA